MTGWFERNHWQILVIDLMARWNISGLLGVPRCGWLKVISYLM